MAAPGGRPVDPEPPPAGFLVAVGGLGPDAAAAGRWDKWQAALKRARAGRAMSAEAARTMAELFGPEDDAGDAARPAAPDEVHMIDWWTDVMNCSVMNCRCARAA